MKSRKKHCEDLLRDVRDAGFQNGVLPREEDSVADSGMSETHFNRSAKAVIFPAETVAGYGLIYSLGLAGVPVAATARKRNPNFKSRYVREFHVVPDPNKDHRAFVDWLTAYGKEQEEKPVLFMAEDVYACIVSLHRGELEPHFRYPWIEPERLGLFFDKRGMFEAAGRAGLRVPATAVNPAASDLENWTSFPCLLKPLVSRFTLSGGRLLDAPKFPDIFGGKALQADTPSELRRTATAIRRAQIDFCVQELIAGPNENIANVKFVSGLDGSIPSAFISRKIRQQPADFGTCCVSRADYVEDLHRQAEAFCRETGYSGPGGMEFKQSEDDGIWHFIEINPRLDFWIRMAVLKGVNLPLQQYLLSTGDDLFRKSQRDGGRLWIDMPGDWAGFRWRRKRPEWRLNLGAFLKPYRWFNEGVFNLRDPRPGLERILRAAIAGFRRHFSAKRGSLVKSIFRPAPLDGFDGYRDYWKKRAGLTRPVAVFPRFETVRSLISPDAKILDYGCGDGAFLEYLESRGCRNLMGYDAVKPEGFPSHFPFLTRREIAFHAPYDVITLLQAVEHIADAEDLINRLASLADKVLVSIPNAGYWRHRLRLLFGRVPVTDVVFHMKEHVRLWTKKDFVEACRHYGWTILALHPTVPKCGILARLAPGLWARQILFSIAGRGRGSEREKSGAATLPGKEEHGERE